MRAVNYDCDRKVNGECLELKQVSTQRQLPPAPAANDSCSVGGPSSDDTIASRLTPLVDRMLLRPAVVQMPAAAGGAGLTNNSIFICLLFYNDTVPSMGRAINITLNSASGTCVFSENTFYADPCMYKANIVELN